MKERITLKSTFTEYTKDDATYLYTRHFNKLSSRSFLYCKAPFTSFVKESDL